MAHRYGLRVLLDLHTVPGGANGFDNGGVTSNLVWLGPVRPTARYAHKRTRTPSPKAHTQAAPLLRRPPTARRHIVRVPAARG